jgi:hypothetical protein
MSDQCNINRKVIQKYYYTPPGQGNLKAKSYPFNNLIYTDDYLENDYWLVLRKVEMATNPLKVLKFFPFSPNQDPNHLKCSILRFHLAGCFCTKYPTSK